MKTKSILVAVFCVLVMSQQSFSVNPNTSKSNEAAAAMVVNLNNDVPLTSEQKEEITKRTKRYQESLEKARAMADRDAATAFMLTEMNQLKASVDSTLTNDQKLQKKNKEKEREDYAKNNNGN